MDNRKGTWTTEIVAGHPCELFEAAERNPNNYVVLDLHGVHQASLGQQQPFIEQFERHGLCVVAPQTRRSWWVDRICAEFDPTLSDEFRTIRNAVFDRELA